MSVTKNPLVNIVIALLVAAALVSLCVPCFVTETDSASVMSYIFMCTYHGGVTDLLESQNPDFILNNQVWAPILLFIFGLIALALMIMKRNTTSSLILPIVFSVFGLITVWTNELTRAGGVTVIPTLLMLACIALCLYNGAWLSGHGESEWKKDPQARGKLKEIAKAVEKKNVNLLASHAQSADVTLRTAAIDGLAAVGGNAVFQPLIGQLSCSNSDIRIAAAMALGKLGDQRGRSFLLHYMESDPDSRVRDAMKKALAQLPSQGE